MATLRIGTAGWALPAQHRHHFPTDGSNLARYAGRLNAAEINSSFHRPHRRATYERWADETPGNFRFSAKLPKTITHQKRMVDCAEALDRFIDEVSGLGSKLAVLLVQLPPKLPFDRALAEAFFTDLESRTRARIACEPRHPSWFEPAAIDMLSRLDIARVVADPMLVEGGDRPGGATDLVYFRLHGAPRIYFSGYSAERLDDFAAAMCTAATHARDIWCILDNTAGSHATGDALALRTSLDSALLRGTWPIAWR